MDKENLEYELAMCQYFVDKMISEYNYSIQLISEFFEKYGQIMDEMIEKDIEDFTKKENDKKADIIYLTRNKPKNDK